MATTATVFGILVVVAICRFSCISALGKTCDDGRYGYECEFECACLDSNEACDKETGACILSGCQKGRWGPGCSLDACPDGRFGLNCGRFCHCRDGRACDKVTGACENGACHPDWEGTYCQTVKVKIAEFYNAKVNPGVEHTNLTCVVSADPRPAPGDIVMSIVDALSDFDRELYVNVGLYSTSKTWVGMKISRHDKFRCEFSRDAAVSKEIDAAFYKKPRLKYKPSSWQTESTKILLQWRKWSASVDAGDGPIVRYDLIMAKSGSQTITTVATVTHDSCSTICSAWITNLQPATEYLFQVVTVREGERGKGLPSPMATGQTACDVPASGPVKMKHNGMEMRNKLVRMTFSWELPGREYFNCFYVSNIQFFLYKEVKNALELVKDDNLGPNALSHTAYSLEPFEKYIAFSRFKTSGGFWSPNSTSVQFLTMESTPSAPVNLAITLSNSSALEVAWDEPLTPRGRIKGYKVRMVRIDGYNPRTCVLNQPIIRRRCVINGLTPYTNYTIQVQAQTNAGWGDESKILPGYTEEELPEEPQNFYNLTVKERSVKFKWEPPLITNGNLQDYKVECSHILNSGSRNPNAEIVHHDTTECSVTNLQPATIYLCTVRAKTSKGYGRPARIQITTLPSVPEKPKVPIVLKEKATDTTITVQLTPVEGCLDYKVMVHKMPEQVNYSRKRRDNLERKSKKDPNYYTAAHLKKDELSEPFVVGDGHIYRENHNTPLTKGQKYDIYFGAGSSNGEVTYYSWSKISEPQIAERYVAPSVAPEGEEIAQGDPSGAIAGAVVVVILMILIAALVAVILYRRKRRQNLDITKPVDEEEMTEKHALTGTQKEEESDTDDAMTNQNTTVDNEPLYTNVGEIRHSIPIDELEEYINDMKRHKKEKFDHEYQQIPWGLTAPCELAKKTENRHKNRYGNIVAYDHSRVILDQIESVPDSDYINADYMDGYTRLKAYIATQGPSKQTAADLWRMAWQENTSKIVMVTNLVEDGRRKCEMYWPEEGSREFGAIEVRIVAVERRADFIMRTFEMTKDNQKRPIKQYHFTAWPDHGAPSHATPLLGFWRKVRSYEVPDSGPMICHCSAGVGRTGTFIALDYLMDQADTEAKINVYSYVKDMRTKRCNMIQTLEQYVFLHNALLEAIKSGNTCIPASEYILEHATLSAVNSDTNKTPMREQFELLQELIGPLNMRRVKTALDAENTNKNRDPTIVPYNSCRPYLITPTEGGTDYINAVFIDSYREKDEFILTQAPLPNTVVDFWRMMYDHHSKVVVMLNEIGPHDESIAKYWPEVGETATHGPFEVEAVAPPVINGPVVVREFKMVYTRKASDPPHMVKQYQLTGWSDNDDTPTSPSLLLDLMPQVLEDSQSGPVTVHCRNGAEHSGLFIAACYIIEKLSLEREVDVFQAVKHICLNRPQLVSSFEQYKFCFELVQTYLDKNQEEPVYGNVNC